MGAVAENDAKRAVKLLICGLDTEQWAELTKELSKVKKGLKFSCKWLTKNFLYSYCKNTDYSSFDCRWTCILHHFSLFLLLRPVSVLVCGLTQDPSVCGTVSVPAAGVGLLASSRRPVYRAGCVRGCVAGATTLLNFCFCVFPRCSSHEEEESPPKWSSQSQAEEVGTKWAAGRESVWVVTHCKKWHAAHTRSQ